MSFYVFSQNARAEDVSANEKAIAALQNSVNANTSKPSVAEVDAQIGVQNVAQNLAISAQYYDNSQRHASCSKG